MGGDAAGAGDSGGSAAGGAAAGSAATPAGANGGSSGSTATGGRGPGNLGGMAGAEGTPTLSLPPGCEPRARTETEETCSLAVFCDTLSRLTNCHRVDSGRWQCQCETVNSDRVYQLEDAPGLEACALTAWLCAEDELELGEESCEPTRESSAESSCKVDLACGRPIALDVETDARAWLMRFGSASCQRAESGKSFECGCMYGEQASEYDLLVASGELACRPLVDFCMSGATPEFEGEQECLLTHADSSSDDCVRTEVCAVPMPLTEDVNLAKVESRYANCVPATGGGADCYCSLRDASFRFRIADAPDDASCESSILNCDEEAVITGTGAASCEPTSLHTYGDNGCGVDLDCEQAATVDEREIVAYGRLVVSCARVEEGTPWWCSCASDQETTRFELGAAQADAWEVCTQAPAGCQEHLTVHLGQYGEFVQPPDPLPPSE